MTKLAESTTFDVQKIRADFPILNEVVHGKPLVYLDNANTTQKPQQVLDALDHYYRHDNANIHRATHLLSERATKAYEGTRDEGAAPDQRGAQPRGRLHARLHRFDQPGRAKLGAHEPEARRRDPRHLDGAPLQHRAVAAGVPADRRDAEGRAHHRRRRARPRRVPGAAHRAHEAAGASSTSATRWARSIPWPTWSPPRAPSAPSRWSTARRPCRICRWTCRRSAATSTRFPATRCTGPPAPASSTAGRRCSRPCRPTRAAAT